MPTTQQFAYFFAFIGAGLVFMILAFSIFLPVIVIAPSKFALSFTIGSLLVMAGFAALRGLKQQASHMLSASRLPFTAGTSALVDAFSDRVFLTASGCVWSAEVCVVQHINLTVSLVPGYLTTMFGTLYAALVMHSYVMSLVCCTLQVCWLSCTFTISELLLLHNVQ